MTHQSLHSSVNMSMAMSPFEVVHGHKTRKLIDIISMTHHPKLSESVSVFTSHVHNLHKEINKKIQYNNAHYKSYVDLHRRHLEFNKGDYIMIQIRPERFSPGTIKKLYARSVGLFKFLRKPIQMPV